MSGAEPVRNENAIKLDDLVEKMPEEEIKQTIRKDTVIPGPLIALGPNAPGKGEREALGPLQAC